MQAKQQALNEKRIALQENNLKEQEVGITVETNTACKVRFEA